MNPEFTIKNRKQQSTQRFFSVLKKFQQGINNTFFTKECTEFKKCFELFKLMIFSVFSVV